ncbi:acyltransferase [Paenibacillus sp. AN1007]|uniref:Acyltransferase n=1 Tax=Paenibacillus sp. AN1007 TaxID=3151385 RepID=A0AAU8NBT6_9BACL
MNKKILYLDNIKSFMAVLVIVFHTNSAYGAEGGWYYVELSNDELSKTILTFVNAVCQTFFMGLFFFISAYFTPPSFDKKGFYPYIKGRVFKLLIPALFYYFILNPFCIFLVEPQSHLSLSSFGFYNMWFIMALFYFSSIYGLVRKWFGGFTVKINFPSKIGILYFILLIGSLNFVTRLIFPTNMLYIHDFSLGYFPQYIMLFWLGTVAYRNNWLDQIDSLLTSFYFRISLITIVTLPAAFLLIDLYGGSLASFYGGFTFESLYYSFWEPFTSIGIILKIITVFKTKFNFTNSFLSRFNRSSYAIYIFQAPIIVSLQLALQTIDVNIIIKVMLVSSITLIISFYLSRFLLKNKMLNQMI